MTWWKNGEPAYIVVSSQRVFGCEDTTVQVAEEAILSDQWTMLMNPTTE
jgi:hypothetical protein